MNKLYEHRVIDLPSATITELDDNIVRIVYKEREEEIGLEDAKAHAEALQEFGKGEPFYVIVNFLHTTVSISNRARDYFAHDERYSKLRLAQAIIIDGLAQKIVGNFYKNFHRPDCPVELFTNEEDAIDWIHSLQ